MTTRRQFIFYSGIISGISIGAGNVHAALGSAKEDHIDQYEKLGISLRTPENDPDFGSLIRGSGEVGTVVGTGRSKHSDVATAFGILFNKELFKHADEEGHMGVAKYLENITLRNEEGNLFKAEWGTGNVIANPLITCLFGLTNTAPSKGDETSWCTAFVNFCLYAAGKLGTFSALSGSFRKYGDDVTENPQVGDIVVFKNYGDSGNNGQGHVGFFVDYKDKDHIIVLGGNQGGTGKGVISQKPIPINGNSMSLHSIRRSA